MKLRYTPRAAHELEVAVDWYEEQYPGLGIEFLDSVDAALALILDNPSIYPRTHEYFRRCLIKRFPFSIHFTIEDDVIVLHSLFDNRRDPKQLP
jgi:plasmid stabilization system protein ParE